MKKIKTKSKDEVKALWKAKVLIPSQAQLDLLAQIGGIHGDAYGNRIDWIAVPCKVTLKDGRIFDCCEVRFIAQAKITLQSDPIPNNQDSFLISDVEKMEVSPFALPYEVIHASTLAYEQNPGHAPTIIEDPEGKVYKLSWTSFFYTNSSFNGADFKLYKEPYKAYPPDELFGKFVTREASSCIVYANWIEGYEKILLRN